MPQKVVDAQRSKLLINKSILNYEKLFYCITLHYIGAGH